MGAIAAFGSAIIKHVNAKGVSRTVCCPDPEWRPALISNWDHKLSPSGESAKAAMREEIQ